MMIPAERLQSVISRHEEITAQLSSAPEPETFVRLSRELAELDDVAAKARELLEAERQFGEARQLMEDPASDQEMRALAEAEQHELKDRIAELNEELQILLLPKDAADAGSAILEVRAGTGGDEAALFAGDLYRMYERYVAEKGWKIEVLSASEGTVGGYKEIVASVTGRGVFARLKFESGVHRVQRVPVTESSGRIQTSAATVAVLPEAEDVDIEIRDEDIRIDTMRSSGAGGQHVNTTDSAVRITHERTGIVVQCQNDRSQHKNKDQAMKQLRARLYEYELQKRNEAQQKLEDAKSDIGWGSQIRSYVLDQSRIKDLRTNVEIGNTQGVLDGDLDPFVEASLKEGL
jgi:peptide chain release factor 1